MKTKSMDMMKYVLSKAKLHEEKYDYISMTLPRVLIIFKHLIMKKFGAPYESESYVEKKLTKLTRISSLDRKETQLYLQ
jgi:hypothetical protein